MGSIVAVTCAPVTRTTITPVRQLRSSDADSAVSMSADPHPLSSTGPSIRVGIAGCTGVVGQRFVSLLQNHPSFVVAALSASERSAGQLYRDACSWKLASDLPADAASLPVLPTRVEEFVRAGVRAVFSALDATVAGEFETALARAGIAVFSNARNHRYDARVPILIPHANAEHVHIIPHQQKAEGFPAGGFIVTNANCSSTGLVVALRPLRDAFGIEKLFVTTLQAISGAGYPGVASLDITDNVVPFISGEEDKMEVEPQKILGSITATGEGDGLDALPQFAPADFVVSAQCNRVHVIDGHTECVSVKLRKPATVAQVEECMRQWQSEAQTLRLHSAPAHPLFVHSAENRPQPRLDRDRDNGFVVTVGRVRTCPLLDFKFTLCSHNTVLGAAGGSILNAELAVAKGFLSHTA